MKVAAPAAAPEELGFLCGTVRGMDGKPIRAATVELPDVGVGIRTDRAGRFCLTIPVGDRPLIVTSEGFEPAQQRVNVGRQTTELSITLRAQAAPVGQP